MICLERVSHLHLAAGRTSHVRLGAQKSRSHVTRLLIGTLTIALWSSSTQSTLVADTPLKNIVLTIIRVLYYIIIGLL